MLMVSALGILALLLLLCFPPGRTPAAANVNAGRQFEIDLAKVISIVWMVLVHVDEECYKNVEFAPGPETWINRFIEFVGGPLAAPVFMIAMGIGLAYSKNQDPKVNAIRGLKLIGIGYLLNIARGTLPCLVFFGWHDAPELLYQSLEELLCLDILHFAGLTFIFFALARRLRLKDFPIGLIALTLLIAGAAVAPVYPDSELRSVWIGYFLYQNPLTPFPLTVWLIYPVAGYLFGKVLLQVAAKAKFYARLLAGGALLLGGFTALLLWRGYDLTELFIDENTYSQNPVKVFWILGIAAVWCGLLYFASLPLTRSEQVKKLVAFMSRKINAIFISQWLLIGWMTWGGYFECAVYGYKFWFFFAAITILAVVMACLAEAVRIRHENRKIKPDDPAQPGARQTSGGGDVQNRCRTAQTQLERCQNCRKSRHGSGRNPAPVADRRTGRAVSGS